MLPEPIKKLEKHFQKYPGVGPRQASRYVFFLLKQPKEYLENFINDLDYLKKQISLCENCNLPKQKQNPYCKICSDEKREKNTIYLVEKEQDAINLESTNIHNGTYFILGENISPIGDSVLAKERVKNLIRRLKKQVEPAEVVLALNNTREGNFAAMYIKEMFKENEMNNVKLTSLGRGLSTGSELESADEEALRNALKNRG